MWNMFDQYLVLLSVSWALYIIIRKLTKKSYLSCNTPCKKKIFNKNEGLITLRRKA